MNLIKDADKIWHQLWSVRLAIASALFGVLEVVLPLVQSAVPPHVFLVLSIVSALWSAYARLVPQPAIKVGTTAPV